VLPQEGNHVADPLAGRDRADDGGDISRRDRAPLARLEFGHHASLGLSRDPAL
jgi:hypothetical protein